MDGLIFMINVGKYTSPMDAIGVDQSCILGGGLFLGNVYKLHVFFLDDLLFPSSTTNKDLWCVFDRMKLLLFAFFGSNMYCSYPIPSMYPIFT